MKTPHYYVPTKPYKGCAICSYGPGAFVHNEYEVDRYIFARILGEQFVPRKDPMADEGPHPASAFAQGYV